MKHINVPNHNVIHYKEITFNDKLVCNCACHKNSMVMHCVPCCDLTGYQYIDESGNLDDILYKKLKGLN